jgi:DNA repair protein RadC
MPENRSAPLGHSPVAAVLSATAVSEHLPDPELLALVLGAGTLTAPARALARALLAHFGDLAELGRALPCELDRVASKATPTITTALLASLELGRRSVGRRPRPGQRLATAGEVYAHYRARLCATPVEEFWVLALDVRHRLIFEACIARGSLTGVEVHPREVFRPLIRGGAAATIVCHNHPSGDPTPSRQDLDLTARLKEVGALCGIAVLDHLVVGAEGYVSLAERGWL